MSSTRSGNVAELIAVNLEIFVLLSLNQGGGEIFNLCDACSQRDRSLSLRSCSRGELGLIRDVDNWEMDFSREIGIHGGGK